MNKGECYMNKKKIVGHSVVISVCLAIAVTIMLTGCLNDESDQVQPVPVSYVSIYNAAPDAPGLDLIVDEHRINNNPFNYTDHTGYLNFFTGERRFKISSVNASNAFVDTTFQLVDGRTYSLFMVDRVSSLEALLVTDSSATPAAGNAMVRFINLSPDASSLSVVGKHNSDSVNFAERNFKQVTPFQPVNAETFSFEVTRGSNNEALLKAENISLEPGKYYTIIVRGFKNPPAGVANGLSIEII
jgi:hypothetical protein